MSSKSQDWSALASHNERVVAGPAALPGPDPQPAAARLRPPQVKNRLRLRKRAGRTGTAARA
jgi:hypothetical protein